MNGQTITCETCGTVTDDFIGDFCKPCYWAQYAPRGDESEYRWSAWANQWVKVAHPERELTATLSHA